MKELNIGLIGTGFMGQAHADSFRRVGLVYGDMLPPIHLKILADKDLEVAKRSALRYGFENHTDNWRDILEDKSIDVVDICSPNFMHFEMALEAIKKGKHVYCEKPLTLKVSESEILVKEAKKAGVQTMLGFNNVKTPAALFAKQLIDEGAIGQLTYFHGVFDQGFFNDPNLPYSWRCERKMAGTGALGDLGAHAISVAQFLMGKVHATCAQSQTFFSKRPVPQDDRGYGSTLDIEYADWKEVENEDQVQALVKFENGAGGIIESSRIAAGSVFGICWEVHGTEGSIKMDGERFNELKLFQMKDDKRMRGYKTILAGSQVPQFKGFFGFDFAGGGLGYFDVKVIEVFDLLSAISEGRNCFPNFAFGLENQKIIEAIDCSMNYDAHKGKNNAQDETAQNIVQINPWYKV